MTKMPPSKIVPVAEKEDLNLVLKLARVKYGRYPRVLAVAVDVKYRNLQTTDEVGIVFFVEKKEDSPPKKLPRYLYGRFADGRVNFRKRIKTDVIQVGRVELACKAGSDVYTPGESGTITLFFRNKAPSDHTSYYILTCSHVVGDMEHSPPEGQNANLQSRCCAGVYPFAETLKNSVIDQNLRMPYDIALAKVTNQALAHLGPATLTNIDGAVIGTSDVLRQILPHGQIGLNDDVQCALASGGLQAANVSTHDTEFPINYGGMGVSVSDLYTLKLHVAGGDSGGLVYRDRAAIGIIVARSPEGWAWFHPLDNALNYLHSLNPHLELKIFL